jgi:O-antigen ligase
MTSDAGTGSRRTDRLLLFLAAFLLLVCFVCGGNSARGNLGTMSAQLLAIPILVYAVIQSSSRGRLRAARWPVFVVSLIVLVPLLQLLPMPTSLWTLPAARVSLLQDLNAVGVNSVEQHWSLSPAATERDLLFLLPGLALFFCMLAAGRKEWRQMLWIVIGLCGANLALAFAQMAAGQTSLLNPYPDFAPAMAGIFANRNHQAGMLAIGLMLVAMFLLNAWKQARADAGPYGPVGALSLVALIFILALPLIGSRAGVIVAMLMLMGVLLTSGISSRQTLRHNHLLQIGSVLVLVVFVVGLQAALGWMKNDAAIDGSRYAMSSETLRIGVEHAPLGAGIGTFIPVFQQAASDDFLTYAYVNNAHNEYAQWWLEAGIVGALVTVLALIVLINALIGLLGQRQKSKSRLCGMAAMMGMGVIVLHSTVDYPLRTPALMAIFAVLSGIAIAAATRAESTSTERIRHDE